MAVAAIVCESWRTMNTYCNGPLQPRTADSWLSSLVVLKNVVVLIDFSFFFTLSVFACV